MAASGLVTAWGPGQVFFDAQASAKGLPEGCLAARGRACLLPVGEDAHPSALGTSVGPSWPS